MRHPTKENNAEEPEEPEDEEADEADEAEDVSDIMDDSSKDSCNFTSLLCTTVPASGPGSSFIGGEEKVAADFRMNGIHGRVLERWSVKDAIIFETRFDAEGGACERLLCFRVKSL